MSRQAATLTEARRTLDPRPLVFGPDGKRSEAEDPEFYQPLPRRSQGQRRLPAAIESIKDRLLNGGLETKAFLSGHVGSGKSTELGRLMIDPVIRDQFTVVPLRFEEQEWAILDSSQVQFRIAGALYERAKRDQRLTEGGRWLKILKEVEGRLSGPGGIITDGATIGAEFNLIFLKVKQELRLSEKRRVQFRELGETLQGILLELIRVLVDDYEQNLANNGERAQLLLVVDDLDKVRGIEAQRDIFETNLNALLALPLRAVYTLPTGVTFGASRADVRQNLEHLYPVKIIDRSQSLEPEDAYLADRFGFFLDLVHKRVAPELLEGEAIRLAAIHSGGVLRDFFHLLRRGIQIAQYNDLDALDDLTMRAALRDEKLRESAGLYGPDFAVLSEIHRTKQLRSDEDRHYLDESRVLECYNDQVWFDVKPLLWPLLTAAATGGAQT